jgi:hypothetical protein
MTGGRVTHLKGISRWQFITISVAHVPFWVLIATHVAKKFLVCYGTRMFNALFIKDCHLVVTAAYKIQITNSHTIYRRSILILSSGMCIAQEHSPTFVFSIKTAYVFVTCPVRVTVPANLMLLDIITLNFI